MQHDFSSEAQPLDPMDEVLNFEFDEMLSDLPGRTVREERLNMWSHGLFAAVSFFAAAYLMWLAWQSGQPYALSSALIYGATMVLLYVASALYHGARDVRSKKRWRILDHCAIFLFIAGNYTPLLLLTVGGETGWSLFYFQWSIAFLGVLLKIKFTGRYDWYFIALFVGMAWIGVMQGNQLYVILPSTAFHLLVGGGVVYMLGIIFYKLEGRLPYAHLIWHLFVMAGCTTHYLMILWYVFV